MCNGCNGVSLGNRCVRVERDRIPSLKSYTGNYKKDAGTRKWFPWYYYHYRHHHHRRHHHHQQQQFIIVTMA